jgi:methionyl aminopeptidase
MSIETVADLQGMQQAGRVTRAVLNAMKDAVRPLITTLELDDVARQVLVRHRARSAPMLVYGFPGYTCISVNEEVVHGVPSQRQLLPGDLVKLDVTVECGGYMADACETVVVGGSPHQPLIDCAVRAFERGLAEVRVGARAYDIGTAVQREVQRSGFSVVHDLTGHGIGRTIHEAPTIPNHRDLRCAAALTEGLIFTIEPLVSAGTARTRTKADGWTVQTCDRSMGAHYEHTVMMTEAGPVLWRCPEARPMAGLPC